MCMCTTCVPDAHGGQMRVLASLERELWMVVSYYVDVRTVPGASADLSVLFTAERGSSSPNWLTVLNHSLGKTIFITNPDNMLELIAS